MGIISRSDVSTALPLEISDPDVINIHIANMSIPTATDFQLRFLNSHDKRSTTDKFSFHTIAVKDVLKIIKSIKSNAVGTDGISLNKYDKYW